MSLVEFTDPRLVAIYDAVNAYLPESQPRFYCELAAELGAVSIVDLGCGTGMITCMLAEHGYRMIGVEPAPAMLRLAQGRRYGDRVTWIAGDSGQLGTPDADLAIMTGHVAQFFLTDESWHAALTALHAALRPGGHLAFESRNPAARAWEQWNRANRGADDPAAGPVEVWCEVLGAHNGIVTYDIHYRFASNCEEVVAPSRLRFRTEEELRASLADAGFAVDRIYGDWEGRPSGPAAPEHIVVAVTA